MVITATGNLLLSAAILLCVTFTGIANLADVLNLAMFSERRFYDLQKDYVYPVVHTTYIRQEAVIEYLRLRLSGDSPGYSAKYATYLLMDSAIDLILDYSLVHVSEMGSFVAMEKEGLRRCLDKLFDQGVDIIFSSYRQTYWCT